MCLAARLGDEVEAFRKLGYFCYGIDLNNGLNNKYVVYGDFNKLTETTSSVDIINTNSLDHLFDLDDVLNEIDRVLIKDGLFVCDLILGYKERLSCWKPW